MKPYNENHPTGAEDQDDMEVLLAQSFLAPQVRICIESYGKKNTYKALSWIAQKLKEENESH